MDAGDSAATEGAFRRRREQLPRNGSLWNPSKMQALAPDSVKLPLLIIPLAYIRVGKLHPDYKIIDIVNLIAVFLTKGSRLPKPKMESLRVCKSLLLPVFGYQSQPIDHPL